MPLSPRAQAERRARNKRLEDPVPVKRIRCKNCGKLTEKRKPWAKFCSSSCRHEFARHGSAFGPLKTTLENLVKKWLKDYQERVERLERALVELKESQAFLRTDIQNLKFEGADADRRISDLENK